ncbi:hypothetical protein ABZ412_13715 [Nocardia sp. NPDC005746]|uniref:hypothetical protein n=1 Tax=Nocardia sp. NPDC005746 TaxID=3157062 RepID=UPI0033C45336
MNRNNHTRRRRSSDRYTGLSDDERDAVIRSLRELGESYRDIAERLGTTARQVETVLGEVAALHTAGHSDAEVGRRVGLPRSTVHRLRGKVEPRSNLRKATALTLLTQHGGMQLDLLSMFLGMERPHVYVLVRQLREEKLVRPLERVQAGDKWVVATSATASRFLGWPVQNWRPSLGRVEHHRAVAQARLMLVGADLQAWVSERELWHRAQRASYQSRSRRTEFAAGRAHIHDGWFFGRLMGVSGWWAVEVELTPKSPLAMDRALLGAIRAARDSESEDMVGVLYLCRTARVSDGVNAAAERLPPEIKNLDLTLVVRDFDDEWGRYLASGVTKPTASQLRTQTLKDLS